MYVLDTKTQILIFLTFFSIDISKDFVLDFIWILLLVYFCHHHLIIKIFEINVIWTHLNIWLPHSMVIGYTPSFCAPASSYSLNSASASIFTAFWAFFPFPTLLHDSNSEEFVDCFNSTCLISLGAVALFKNKIINKNPCLD